MDQLVDPATFVKKVMTVYAQPSAVSHDLVEMKDGRIISSHPRGPAITNV